MEMRNKRLVVAAIAVTMAAGGTVNAIYAGSCPSPYYEVDQWELELVAVTVDGEKVDEGGESEGLSFAVQSRSSSSRVQLALKDVESGASDLYVFRQISTVP